jgi:hypothetical protein
MMHTMLFSHVLVPYDSSELPIKLLDKVIEFAQLNPNMKITVLHIVSIPPKTAQISLYNQLFFSSNSLNFVSILIEFPLVQ